MSIEFTDEIVRFLVTVQGKRTTISLDGVLSQVMSSKLGGENNVTEWIRKQAASMGERSDFNEKKLTIGLSRLIQQQAILMVSGETMIENH